MNFLEQAIQMEIEGEQFYRELAEQSTDPGVKTILSSLADDEVKHRHLFEQMKSDKPAELVPTDAGKVAVSNFEQLRAENKHDAFKESIRQALAKAQDVEMKSYHHYKALVDQISNPDYKALVLKIAAEEEKHAGILLDLLNYYLSPKQWLENAEWNHHDEY